MITGNIEQACTKLEQLIKESPQFVEAHVSLATVYYRLKRKADGDRERATVLKLNAESQAAQPGAKEQWACRGGWWRSRCRSSPGRPSSNRATRFVPSAIEKEVARFRKHSHGTGA